MQKEEGYSVVKDHSLLGAPSLTCTYRVARNDIMRERQLSGFTTTTDADIANRTEARVSQMLNGIRQPLTAHLDFAAKLQRRIEAMYDWQSSCSAERKSGAMKSVKRGSAIHPPGSLNRRPPKSSAFIAKLSQEEMQSILSNIWTYLTPFAQGFCAYPAI